MTDEKAQQYENMRSLDDHWSAIIGQRSKRQRKDIRRVLPFFMQKYLRIDDIDQNDLNELCNRLQGPSETNLKCEMPEKQARWTVNSAVRALSDVQGGALPCGPLEGDRAEAKRRHKRFLDAYGNELANFRLTRNVDKRTHDAEANAFKNCVTALGQIGISPDTLQSLVTPEIRFDLMEILYKRGRLGSFGMAMRTLASFSLYCGHTDAEDAYENFTNAARQYDSSPAMSSNQVERILPYLGRMQFGRLVQLLREEARISPDFDPSAIRRANRTASAVYALMAIFVPATFGVIHSAEFMGPMCSTSKGDRPTLKIAPYDETLEKFLHPKLVEIIDDLYWAYARAGLRPRGIMNNRNGDKRPAENAISSVEALLASLVVQLSSPSLLKSLPLVPSLTLLDLRELGIAQALRAGDSPSRIARAARLSERAFWNRYADLENILKQIKD